MHMTIIRSKHFMTWGFPTSTSFPSFTQNKTQQIAVLLCPLHIFLWTCNFLRFVYIVTFSFIFVVNFTMLCSIWKFSFNFLSIMFIEIDFIFTWFHFKQIVHNMEEKLETSVNFTKFVGLDVNFLIYAMNIK